MSEEFFQSFTYFKAKRHDTVLQSLPKLLFFHNFRLVRSKTEETTKKKESKVNKKSVAALKRMLDTHRLQYKKNI